MEEDAIRAYCYDDKLNSAEKHRGSALLGWFKFQCFGYDNGVGCCWVMHFNPAAMCESFNIPQNTEPLALLVMGYPSYDAKPLELHFKQRSIKETVFYDSF